MPWVAASNSSQCWETLEQGGCVILEKPVAQTGSRLCGHKAASLSSRLFHSKQVREEVGRKATRCCPSARAVLRTQQEPGRGQRGLQKPREPLCRLISTAQCQLGNAALCSAHVWLARASSIQLRF